MSSESTETQGGLTSLHYLHPTSPFFKIVNDLRKAVFPLIALFAFRGQLELWYLLFLIPGAIYSLVQYLALRYRFAEDEIVVKKGLIFRNERHIPFHRIQNIDLVQNVLHRAAGVAEVRIETASGTEPEATLQVLSLSAVEQMRHRVFADRRHVAGSEAPAPLPDSTSEEPTVVAATDEQMVLALPTSELIRLGLISNRGIVLVGAALGLIWEFYFAGQYQPPWGPEMIKVYRVDEIPALSALSALLVSGAVVAGIALLLLLSVAWTIYRLHGYRLERVGDDLRIEAGLFTRVSATIPRGRIQFLSVRASPLHRLFGRVSVKVETAGADSNETSSLTREWFIPVLPKDRLDEVLDQVHPELWTPQPNWQPLSGGAWARKLKRASLLPGFFALTTLPLWWGLSAVILFVWLPLALWHASRSAQVTKWAVTPHGVAFRDGVITQKTSCTLLEKIQVVATHRSPFDVRKGMASLKVDTAGSTLVSHKIDIPMLDEAVAEGLRVQLGQKAAASDFTW